ncbi:queuosine precursor transporter [Aquabacter cavernae]|uniref:queuosine precursor transporter n=1 Tax=Aquabacter cavernae TaxID=2496029 RepID=UPI001FE20E24|nr:queuosine precursor transporter [Aquabacter cavernae]
MCAAVLAANILVQFPFTPFGLEDVLTWGAFTYPVTFLVNDLTNRRLGLARTKHVVYAGFALAVLLSAAFASPRIALASGVAFLSSQLLDAVVFNRLRRRAWWIPPLSSGFISAALDTAIFFALAFGGTDLPWQNWALFDYGVKLAMIGLFLGPYRMLIDRMPSFQGADTTQASARP